MKRNSIKLICSLAVCIIALFCTVFLVDEANEREENKVVFGFDKKNITAVSWQFDDKRFALEKIDDYFEYSENKDIIVDSEKIEDMVDVLCSFEYERIVSENVSDTSPYGINNPKLKIVFMYESKEYECDIGNFNNTSKLYYMMNSNGDTLYYTDDSLVNAFSKDILDLVVDEKLPKIDEKDFVSLNIDTRGEKYLISKDETNKYILALNDTKKICDEQTVKQLYKNLNLMKLKCVKTNVTESDIDKFGFNAPLLKLSYRYYSYNEDETEFDFADTDKKEKGLTLLVSRDKDKNIFLMIGGGSNFYKIIDDDEKKFILDYPFDLLSKQLIDIRTNFLSKIDISYDNSEKNIVVKKSISTTNGTPAVLTRYYDGDNIVKFSDIISIINELRIVSNISENEISKENRVLDISFSYNDGAKTEMEIYRKDDKYFAVIDKKLFCEIDKENTDRLLTAVEPIFR